MEGAYGALDRSCAGESMKSRLGKGTITALSSLAESARRDDEGMLLSVELDDLYDNPNNIRTHYDETKLLELAESIKAEGIVQPLIACRRPQGGYALIAGHRRKRAAQLAGLSTVPVMVRDAVDEPTVTILALVENDQRDDIGPLERARGYAQWLNQVGNYHGAKKVLCDKVGKPASFVSRHLALLDLPTDVLSLCEDEIVTDAVRLAALGGLDDETRASEIARLRGEPAAQVSVTTTPAATAASAKQDKAKPARKAATPDPNIARLADRMGEVLATKVAIRPGHQGPSGKGTVVLHYDNLEVLEGILAKLGLEPE
jgi:ParB family transcriptional regulator, chromosome partitioning protein